MPSRMDRYDTNTATNRRLSKNKQLYEELYTNTNYTELTNLNSSNIVDLTSTKTEFTSRREEYQKNKKFSNVLGSEDINQRQKYDGHKPLKVVEEPNKNYDINAVLEDAKRNRNEVDELEKKRKLRAIEYDILTDLTQEKLKEHQEKKKEVLTKEEENELEELIHTITSKTMRQDIDNELLGDLMPSKLEETMITNAIEETAELDISHEIDNTTNGKPLDDDFDTSKMDDSFFTKSMELTRDDLLSLDEGYGAHYENKRKKDVFIKLIIALSIIILIIIIGIIICNSVLTGN